MEGSWGRFGILFGNPNLPQNVVSTKICTKIFGWKRLQYLLNPIDVEDVISRLSYKDWRITYLWSQDDGYNIVIHFPRPDSITGVMGWSQQMRKWHVEHWRDKEYLVHTIFKAILSAEQHECHEFFKLDGKVVFDPHRKIEGL